jgi:hypothetical protein
VKLFTTVFLLLLFCTVSAQHEADVWCFGDGVGLDFKSSPRDAFRTTKTFYSLEGTASISDSTGRLLFYTNGDSMWNNDHKLMANGYDIGV